METLISRDWAVALESPLEKELAIHLQITTMGGLGETLLLREGILVVHMLLPSECFGSVALFWKNKEYIPMGALNFFILAHFVLPVLKIGPKCLFPFYSINAL